MQPSHGDCLELVSSLDTHKPIQPQLTSAEDMYHATLEQPILHVASAPMQLSYALCWEVGKPPMDMHEPLVPQCTSAMPQCYATELSPTYMVATEITAPLQSTLIVPQPVTNSGQQTVPFQSELPYSPACLKQPLAMPASDSTRLLPQPTSA